MTLPRGPIESQQSWYAGSRLGCYILTCILWGSTGSPVCHLFVIRCNETSAPYSMWVWQHLLQQYVNLEDTEDIVWWSDGGRHFRAAMPIGTMLVQGVRELCAHSKHKVLHEMSINFGVPAHFKNSCDGAQAHARAALTEMAKTKTIKTLEQYVAGATELYSEFSEQSSRMPARFHLVFPTTPRKDFVASYCRLFKTLPEQISVCQSWSLRLNDIRRRGNPVFENSARVLKALTLRANMISGMTCPASRATLPTLVDIPVGPEPEEADEDAAAEEDEHELAADAPDLGPDGVVIPVDSMRKEGWLCSYRRHCPESRDFASWRKRFSRMRAKWQKSGVPLKAPQMRRPIAEQLALQKDWRVRKRKKAVRTS